MARRINMYGSLKVSVMYGRFLGRIQWFEGEKIDSEY